MATIEVTYVVEIEREMDEDRFFEWVDENLIQSGLDIGLGEGAELAYMPYIDPDNE
jgi:hypothetical protein